MHVTAIQTHKVIPGKDTDILAIIDSYLLKLSENTIVAITSKIVSICEGNFVDRKTVQRDDLIAKEADYYLPPTKSKYGFSLAIKNNLLVPSAGVDESNGNGYYILLPKNPQQSANSIRKYIREKHGIKNLGIVITDSTTRPLRWGVTGISLAYSGFAPLNDYIGTPDIFGRELHATKVNVADGLAAVAVLAMGEGKEQSPLAVITDVPFVHFTDEDPSEEELASLRITLEDDVYAPVLQAIEWKRKEK
jgi:dihydrofolate synthase / folylpolyglutamate synthase